MSTDLATRMALWRQWGLLDGAAESEVARRSQLLGKLESAGGLKRLATRSAWPRPPSRGARCTWGVPWAPPEIMRRWLGERLAYWPRGLPQGVAGVASSRLGADLDGRDDWFAGLRAAANLATLDDWTLATAVGVSGWRFVLRAAWWFQAEGLLWRSASSWRNWQRCLTAAAGPSLEAWLSPPLSPPTDPNALRFPWRDRLLVGLSPQLLVLHQRSGGTLEQLLRQRRGEGCWPENSVLRVETPAAPSSDWPRGNPGGPAPAATLEVDDEPFLWHWTRARRGPWPGQTMDDYLDQMIWRGNQSRRDAAAALSRILRTRRLIAQPGCYRGGTAAVSFSQRSLDEWPDLRRYQRHRRRWDFEPYGVGIRQSLAASQGGRPVLYGEDALYESLPPGDRPFFQLAQSGGSDGTDWTREREWRVPHDVSLADCGPNDCRVFVATAAEAARLQRISPWPVIAVGDATQ